MTSLILVASLILFSEANLLPSTCVGREDGVYELQLMESEHLPSVTVVCSNEYLIIDYNKDKNIASYFTSWKDWYPDFVGPLNSDVCNWQDWFRPSRLALEKNQDISFLVSTDCKTCELDSPHQFEGDKSAYYMSGSLFGCGWNRYGLHDCDYYVDSEINKLVCHDCSNTLEPKALDETATADDFSHSGICPVQIKKSTYLKSKCGGIAYKPSLGINGKHCVCYKANSKKISYFLQSKVKQNKEKEDENTEGVTGPSERHPTVLLYQSDFDKGPYRITNPGIYILKEDIVFNFNAGSTDNPLEDDAWWPTHDQNDDYPGSEGISGNPWYLGFFAGITIETSHVTLNLNRHEIKMDDTFYYLQRWFTCIELSTQYFKPGEGPFGNFGANPKYASNVIITNGKIGLSSHHGIHGNDNNHVVLKDLDISGFETHGIQLNGFNTLKIINVNVHDNSKKVYFTSHFSRMKAMLPRFRAVLAEHNDGQQIYFKDREEPTTYANVLEDLESKMMAVWNYVLHGQIPLRTEMSKLDWEDALYTFYNKDGYSYGASVHGIFLNTYSASIFKYRIGTSLRAHNLVLNNVKIYNLYHKLLESISVSWDSVNLFNDYFSAPFDARMMWGDDYVFNIYDHNNAPTYYELPDYVGNTLMDALALFSLYATSWDDVSVMQDFTYLAIDFDKSGINKDTSKLIDDSTQYTFTCGIDTMIHSAKGINALRLDAIDNIHLNKIEIYNIYEKTPLGYEMCGTYGFTKPDVGFRRQNPQQRGFAGHNLFAISLTNVQHTFLNDIHIHDLVSDYGVVYGVAVWPNSDVNLNGDINIYNLVAGYKLEEGIYAYNNTPNQAPDACGILFYDHFVDYANKYRPKYLSHYKLLDNIRFNFEGINGHHGCLGSDKITMIGHESPTSSDALQMSMVDYIKNTWVHNDNGINIANPLNNNNNNNQKKYKSSQGDIRKKVFESKIRAFMYQVIALIAVLGFGTILCMTIFSFNQNKEYQNREYESI